MRKIRKKLVAGNWKMNKSVTDAQQLAEGVKRELGEFREVDVVLCPPFTALKAVSEAIDDTSIKLGAQNMHWEASGAYTGEISASMLRDMYCHYVILGHSERRAHFSENNVVVNRKVKAALGAKLIPILCVGETLQERDAGKMRDVVEGQLVEGLADVAENLEDVVVAYEPVWAIGTGRTATPEQAQEMHAHIRAVLGRIGSTVAASRVRILYGGSMKPDNAAALMALPDVDGGLIGGAALEVRSFVEIVRAAIPAKGPELPDETVE